MYIDLVDINGNKTGPIANVLKGTTEHRLNEPGSFSYELTATARRTLLASLDASEKQALGYGLVGEVSAFLGGGTIEKHALSVQAGGGTVAISGADSLYDLAYTVIRKIEIGEVAQLRPTSVHEINNPLPFPPVLEFTNMYDGNIGTGNQISITGAGISPDDRTYLYIGAPYRFWVISFILGALKNSSGTAFTFQVFYNGGWENVAVTDTTISGGSSLAQNGSWSFSSSVNWTPLTHDGKMLYWFRVFGDVDMTETDINEITLTGLGPTTNALAPLVALAPSGWALNPAYLTQTSKPVYATFNNVTLLEALSRIGELSGDAFRMGDVVEVSPGDYTYYIDWIGATPIATGLRAVGRGDASKIIANENLCLVEAPLRIESDRFSMINRVYVSGAGEGDRRVGLESATIHIDPRGITAVTPTTLGSTFTHLTSATLEWTVLFNGTISSVRPRYVDTSNYWSVQTSATGGLQLVKRAAAVNTFPINIAGVFTSGQSYTIKAELNGNTWRIYVNGTLRGTVTDSFNASVANGLISTVSGGISAFTKAPYPIPPWDWPTGYTLDTADSYIERPLATGERRRSTVYNVGSISSGGYAIPEDTNASNQLARTGADFLQKRENIKQIIDFPVSLLSRKVKPGETVKLTYSGLAIDAKGSFLWIDVDEELVVLDVTLEASEGIGTLSGKLTLSNVMIQPLTGSRIVAKLLRAESDRDNQSTSWYIE